MKVTHTHTKIPQHDIKERHDKKTIVFEGWDGGKNTKESEGDEGEGRK